MTKTQANTAKQKTAELVSQISKAKAAKLKKVHNYQIPTKAHTSNKAKIAIAVSLVQGAVALTVLAAAVVHKAANRNGCNCHSKVARATETTEAFLAEEKGNIAETVEETTKSTRRRKTV